MTAAPGVLPTSLLTSRSTSAVGLDQLRLPMPNTPFAECAGCEPRPPASRPAQGDDHASAVYRWVLGHHLVFCVWRLMCDYLSRTGSEEALASEDALAELHDTYSACLLYAGSCTEEIYAGAVRARMAACHPGFSGMWARDYERVHELLGRARPAPGSRFQRAVRFNRLVHVTVARRLVPSGGSLRRDSGNQASVTTDAERDLLDWFFLIERVVVCRHAFADQIIRRIILTLTDIAIRPVSARYDREEINRFQAELARHLEPLPRLAAMAPAGRGGDHVDHLDHVLEIARS